MRKSLLLGLFACALIFIVGTNGASATTQINPDTSTDTDKIIERIVDVNETSKSPLLTITKDTIESTEQIAQPVVPELTKHIVSDNENLSKIAELHKTTWKRIYDKNIELNDPNTINVGQELIIPSAEEVLENRIIEVSDIDTVSYESRKSDNTAVSQSAPVSSSGNRYIAGYCTWYVKNRRPDLPNNLGNASTWVSRASAQGLATGSTPAAGAVGQQGNHVVYIESVNGDGTVTVSEMNQVGWNVISSRTVPASYFSYIY